VGTVTGFEDGRLTAVYDEVGYRTVMADDAIARGILQPVPEAAIAPSGDRAG
jgi:hypothetical protein